MRISEIICEFAAAVMLVASPVIVSWALLALGVEF